jgi:hypothetical protein
MCLDCQEMRPFEQWVVGGLAGVGVVNGGFVVR